MNPMNGAHAGEQDYPNLQAGASGEFSPLTALRLRLLGNGYVPIPVTAPDFQHEKVKSPGKQPFFKGWNTLSAATVTPEMVRSWPATVRNHPNTGLICGELVGIDIDVTVPDLAGQTDGLAEAMLGATPLRRIGKAPKLLRCYRVEAPLKKLETPELLLDDGTKLQVEVLGDGQQFVAHGIHPGTGRPYAWPLKAPEDVPLPELPIVTEAAIRGFLAAAEALLRGAGGRTEKEREKAAKADPPRQEERTTGGARPKAGAAGSEFFKAVNRRALDRIGAWLPNIFPRAEQQPGTGAWRVSSADLGRDLEEDLSVHPADGGQDFGTRKSCSPINIVMQHDGAPTPQDAAFWLCERLGIVPAALGWREPKAKRRDKPTPDTGDLNGFDLTEDGVALAFAAKFKDALRYCHDTAAWFEWGGDHWRREKTKLAFSWARATCRQLAKEQGADGKVAAVMAKAGTAAAVERFAQADRAFAVTSETWDRDPWLLGTPAGTVDLHTGELLAAAQTDYITKLAAVGPAARADCPLWLKFLADATREDKGLIRFLQQWCGYTLTGDTREHALVFIYGPGGNGKSVFLNTVSGILADYCRSAAMDTFTASKNDKHPTDLAMLKGARMVCASETEEGNAWAEVRIKQMTGGDNITARFMRQDFFEYRPQFKLVVIGNHKPVLRNVDDAAKRRFNVVPFIHKPTAPDKQLEAKLRAEWPGILRWMIDGCLDWQASGLVRPDVVVRATAEYFGQQDSIQQWVDDCCDISAGPPHVADTNASLFASWRAYALARGEDPGTGRRFHDALERQGFSRIKDADGIRGRGFRGLKVHVHFQGPAE